MTLFVLAMQEEAHLILEKSIYENDVIITGIGKTNAAMKLTEFIASHKVDKIINIGFAGGNKAYQVNDVVVVNKAQYHDFDLTLFGYKKGQVPGYPNHFESNPYLIQVVEEQLNLKKQGELFTGDYFMTEPVEEPALFDMEGASLFQVAWHYKIPMISIKVISDVIGMDNHYDNYKAFEKEVGAKQLFDLYIELKEAFK